MTLEEEGTDGMVREPDIRLSAAPVQVAGCTRPEVTSYQVYSQCSCRCVSEKPGVRPPRGRSKCEECAGRKCARHSEKCARTGSSIGTRLPSAAQSVLFSVLALQLACSVLMGERGVLGGPGRSPAAHHHHRTPPPRRREAIDVTWGIHNELFSNATVPELHVNMKDSLTIRCPHHTTTHPQYHAIHMVSRQGFARCNSAGGRRLHECLHPPRGGPRLSLFTVAFRQFTPLPKGLEFTCDRDYYLISTSNVTAASVEQTVGGSCRRHNMRLKITVHCPGGSLHHTEPYPHVLPPGYPSYNSHQQPASPPPSAVAGTSAPQVATALLPITLLLSHLARGATGSC